MKANDVWGKAKWAHIDIVCAAVLARIDRRCVRQAANGIVEHTLIAADAAPAMSLHMGIVRGWRGVPRARSAPPARDLGDER